MRDNMSVAYSIYMQKMKSFKYIRHQRNVSLQDNFKNRMCSQRAFMNLN
jgi:hypothetical protein